MKYFVLCYTFCNPDFSRDGTVLSKRAFFVALKFLDNKPVLLLFCCWKNKPVFYPRVIWTFCAGQSFEGGRWTGGGGDSLLSSSYLCCCCSRVRAKQTFLIVRFSFHIMQIIFPFKHVANTPRGKSTSTSTNTFKKLIYTLGRRWRTMNFHKQRYLKWEGVPKLTWFKCGQISKSDQNHPNLSPHWKDISR